VFVCVCLCVVCEGVVICGCVYVWVLSLCVRVCVYGFCNVCVCVCVYGFCNCV